MTSPNIRSVERALQVLLYLNKHDGPVGISQISKDLDIYKSTVFRTLQTLEGQHFVEQHKESGKYGLGVVFISMGTQIKKYEIFRPFALQLHEQFNEAVDVSVLDVTSQDVYRSVIVVKEDSKTKILSVSPRLGSVLDCYCSAAGKCLLAFSCGVETGKLYNYTFKRFTENSITDVPRLEKELAQVREQGYAMDNGEQEEGLMCVGVPILDKAGSAVAAISISGPTKRLEDHGMDTIIQQLKQTAEDVSKLL